MNDQTTWRRVKVGDDVCVPCDGGFIRRVVEANGFVITGPVGDTFLNDAEIDKMSLERWK